METKRPLIIFGSSRSNGETRQIIDCLNKNNAFDIIDLNDYQISYYDYEHKNQNDDFIPLMEKIVAEYDHLIFATPVYWYQMSAIMKCFFDRITDLLSIRKEIGRQLRGKSISVISCSGGNDLDKEFIHPFAASAEYLGMDFKHHLHSWLESGKISSTVKEKIEIFRRLF